MIIQPKKQHTDELKFVLGIIFLMLVSTMQSAEPMLSDSLKNLLERAKNDAERIELMLEISNHTAQSDNSTAMVYAHRAALLAALSDDRYAESKAGNQLGILYFKAGILDSAAFYFNRSLKYFPPDADAYTLAAGYNNLGAIYLAKENPDSAAIYFQKALEALHRFKSLNDSLPLPGVTSILNNLGLIYKEKKDYPAARRYFEEGIRSAHKYPKEQRIYARLLNNYGGILTLTGEMNRALDTLEKALRIRQKIEDFGGIVSSFSNLGFYYSEAYDLQNAVHYTKKAYHLSLQFDAKLKIAANAEMLQSLYEEMGLADSSLKYLKVAGTYREQIKTAEANAELQKQRLLDEYKRKVSALNKKKYNTIWQMSTIIFVVVVSVILLLFIYRRMRRKMQAMNSEKNQLRKKTQNQRSHNEILQNEVEIINKNLPPVP
jgi:tetratricopeptide (TPR) repeat protein